MNQLEETQLPLQVLKKFRLIYGSVRLHFRNIEKTCGVSGSQLWLLHEIGKTPGIGVSDLAGRLSIHQSTCSQLVDKLGARALVVKARSQQDQRRVGLTLTESALQALQDAPGPAEGVLPAALQSLPPETLHVLDSALLEVIAQLKPRDDNFSLRPLADL